jgi:hypothetical protein
MGKWAGMNRALAARLTALEGAKSDDREICVVRRIIEADGTEVEPEAYRDWRGNRWEREPGEGLETF